MKMSYPEIVGAKLDRIEKLAGDKYFFDLSECAGRDVMGFKGWVYKNTGGKYLAPIGRFAVTRNRVKLPAELKHLA